jgi:DNA-binding MarR family transcriptional regulator
MAQAKRLSPAEETLWRATMRIVTVLPSHLHGELIRGAGLTASEYTTLLHLSEAPNHEARMSELARSIGLSASRTTRLVDDLQRRGLVTKVVSSSDARSTRARTTTNGLAKLRIARPIHEESVRRRVLDHIDAASLERLADALSAVARQLESGSHRSDTPVATGETPPTVASRRKLI